MYLIDILVFVFGDYILRCSQFTSGEHYEMLGFNLVSHMQCKHFAQYISSS